MSDRWTHLMWPALKFFGAWTLFWLLVVLAQFWRTRRRKRG